MDLSLSFSEPFYGGTGGTVTASKKYHVALDGRGYMLDTEHEAFKQGLQTIPFIRQQADNSDEPGESTVNREDLWPRSQSSWHLGAGQEYLDSPESVRTRFRTSFGVNPWKRGQLSLLNSVGSMRTSANTNLGLLRVGDYVYIADGNAVLWAQAPYTSWTSTNIFNGETAQSVKSLASDGYTIYAALGSNGIHTTVRGGTTSTHYSDLSATLVDHVMGRLMAANGNAIYNVTAAGAAPSALFSSPNTDFKWVGFAEGHSCIYAAGYSGDKSLIYRTAVKSDGTGLDAAIVAGSLPDGEVVRSITGYLGFVLVGSDLGLRLATANEAGDLTFGALITTDRPVRCWETQDRFAWFGWDNFDANCTGLGRVDLSVLTAESVPAFAPDLMTGASGSPVQGQVVSACTTPTQKRALAVNGVGFFLETSTPVPSGYIDSGLISFGIPDPKIALRMTMKHKPLTTDGRVAVYVQADDAARVPVGASDTAGTTSPLDPIRIPEVSAQLFEVRMQLEQGAVLERYAFQAYPASRRGSTILVPLLLHDKVHTLSQDEVTLNPRAEYDYVEGLVGQRRLISYQELRSTYTAFVEETNLQRSHPTTDKSWWNGTLVCRLKVLGD